MERRAKAAAACRAWALAVPRPAAQVAVVPRPVALGAQVAAAPRQVALAAQVAAALRRVALATQVVVDRQVVGWAWTWAWDVVAPRPAEARDAPGRPAPVAVESKGVVVVPPEVFRVVWAGRTSMPTARRPVVARTVAVAARLAGEVCRANRGARSKVVSAAATAGEGASAASVSVGSWVWVAVAGTAVRACPRKVPRSERVHSTCRVSREARSSFVLPVAEAVKAPGT